MIRRESSVFHVQYRLFHILTGTKESLVIWSYRGWSASRPSISPALPWDCSLVPAAPIIIHPASPHLHILLLLRQQISWGKSLSSTESFSDAEASTPVIWLVCRLVFQIYTALVSLDRQRASTETCDLSDFWSDWCGSLTWPTKNLPSYLPIYPS